MLNVIIPCLDSQMAVVITSLTDVEGTTTSAGMHIPISNFKINTTNPGRNILKVCSIYDSAGNNKIEYALIFTQSKIADTLEAKVEPGAESWQEFQIYGSTYKKPARLLARPDRHERTQTSHTASRKSYLTNFREMTSWPS